MTVGGAELPLTVEVLDGGSVMLVRVGGIADYGSGATLRAVLDEVLAEGRPIIVDVGPLRLLDAFALNILLVAHRRVARRHESGLRLAGASGIVLRVLQLTGADKLFDADPGGPPDVREAGPLPRMRDRTVETLLRAAARQPGPRERDALRRMALAHRGGPGNGPG